MCPCAFPPTTARIPRRNHSKRARPDLPRLRTRRAGQRQHRRHRPDRPVVRRRPDTRGGEPDDDPAARELAGSSAPVPSTSDQIAVCGRPPAPAVPGIPGGPDGGRPRTRRRRRAPAHGRRAQPGAGISPRADGSHRRAVQRGGCAARRAQRRQPDRRTRRGAVPPGALRRRRRLASRAAPCDGPRPVDAVAPVWRVPRPARDSCRVSRGPAEPERRQRGGRLRAPEGDHGRAHRFSAPSGPPGGLDGRSGARAYRTAAPSRPLRHVQARRPP